MPTNGSGLLFQQANEKQQNDRAEGGCADRADQPTSRDAEQAEQKTPDDGADNADDDVTQQAEPAALHEQSGEPAGDGADHQKDDETLCIHFTFLDEAVKQGCERGSIQLDEWYKAESTGNVWHGTCLDRELGEPMRFAVNVDTVWTPSSER